MHLNPGQIERALDPELPAEADLKQHLADCAECRARLADAQREESWLRDRLQALDHSPPSVTAESLMSRFRRTRRRWERLAAGIVLALAAAGVAYATPGSPLPHALRRLVGLVIPARTTEASPLTDSLVSPAGIAVDPGERLIVEFASTQTGDTAMVSLSDGAEVVVRVFGGTTTFTSQADRLIVRHSGTAGRFEILIPRAAPSVTLTSGARELWVKNETRIDSGVSSTAGERYLLPLSPNPQPPALE